MVLPLPRSKVEKRKKDRKSAAFSILGEYGKRTKPRAISGIFRTRIKNIEILICHHESYISRYCHMKVMTMVFFVINLFVAVSRHS
jgi:hypothetical protein